MSIYIYISISIYIVYFYLEEYVHHLDVEQVKGEGEEEDREYTELESVVYYTQNTQKYFRLYLIKFKYIYWDFEIADQTSVYGEYV